MSFGLVEADTIRSKKALIEAVKQRGADAVEVFDTSGFGNLGTINLARLFELKQGAAVIVGPDVYNKRTWFANLAQKPDGTVYVK